MPKGNILGFIGHNMPRVEDKRPQQASSKASRGHKLGVVVAEFVTVVAVIVVVVIVVRIII